MRPQPFDPPAPDLASSHDVRKVNICKVCYRAGTDLPVIERSGKKATRWAHTFCIVEKYGWRGLAALAYSEVMKTTVSDLVALGLTYDEFMAKVNEARSRK